MHFLQGVKFPLYLVLALLPHQRASSSSSSSQHHHHQADLEDPDAVFDQPASYFIMKDDLLVDSRLDGGSTVNEESQETMKPLLPCPPPNITYNGSLLSGEDYGKRLWAEMEPDSFKAIREVEFEVRVGPFPKEKQKCKLTCLQGQWVGPLCRSAKDNRYQVFLRSCELNYQPPHTIITYKFREIKLKESTLFPNEARVYFRCEGSPSHNWTLDGNATLVCHDGTWSHRLPVCRKTSTKGNFSEDLPPQLSIYTASGHSSIGPSGELIVYPGSIIHLDCLFSRKMGNPVWTVENNSDKTYPTGWFVNEADKDWQFRLSVYYVKAEDSNTFTCHTPRRQSSSIRIEVTDVECPDFHIAEMELESRMQGRKIGSEAVFSCPIGYNLIGKTKLKCLKNGSWSSAAPHCQPVKCTALEILDPHLRVLSLNNSFQGQATFLCPFGYRLDGLEAISCGAHGLWSGAVPSCTAIECPSPLSPESGRLVESGRHLVGQTVQYICDEGFVLIGEPIIRCTEAGLWSHAPPFCKRACRFPGDPSQGRITPVKFLYEVGDKILIQCNTGFVNTGRQKLQCTDTGNWSDRMPTCLSYMSSSP